MGLPLTSAKPFSGGCRGSGDAGDACDDIGGFIDGRNVDDEALEIVVVVPFRLVVM